VSGERKVPRIDYGKYRGGRAAGRREAVTVLGDSLRELACVRLQGHVEAGGAAGDEGLRGVARGVLEAVAEYFGLPAGALLAAAARELAPVIDEVPTIGDAAAGRELRPVPGLLLLMPEVPAGLQAAVGAGEWWGVAAHPGELVAFAGERLAALTAGRVPAAAVRWPPSGVAGWLLPAAEPSPAAPLPEFASS
jgi:hypothetical protein